MKFMPGLPERCAYLYDNSSQMAMDTFDIIHPLVHDHTGLGGLMLTKIKFGTDGWRGRIAEDYTFTNVRRCAQGFATYISKHYDRDEWIVVWV